MKNKLDSNKDKLVRLAVSFLMAFFLWVYALSATGQTETRVFKDIPVKIINESSLTALGLALDNQEYTVDVKLYGSTLQVSQIRKSDLVAVLDVSSIKSVGNHSIAVNVSGVSENVSVSEINDRYISVSVSDLVKTEHSIEVLRGGTVAEGYAIIGESYSAKTATIYGNEANVKKVATIRGSIDVSAVTGDLTRRANLAAYDEEGNIVEHISLVPAFVDVDISIGKIKEVPVMVSMTGSIMEGYVVTEISPERETVNIAAKEDVLALIDSVSTADIDLTGRNSSFTQTVSLHGISDGVLLTEGPVKVSITIEPKENKEITFSTIRFLNTPEGYSCELVDFNGIKAVFSGEKKVLQEMDGLDITAYVDLEGLKKGEHTVMVQFSTPEGITLGSGQEVKVKVNISK